MFQQLRETKRLDSLAELFFNICKFRCQTLLIQKPLVKYICSNSKQVHTLNVSITSSFSLLTVFCSSLKHRWVSHTYEFCILPGRPATLWKNIKLSPFTTQKTKFSFFGCPEKMVFPNKLCWNMIFLVLSGKMIFLFPENMIFLPWTENERRPLPAGNTWKHDASPSEKKNRKPDT